MVIDRIGRTKSLARGTAAAIWLVLLSGSAAAAATDPAERCGRAIVGGSSKVLKADVQALRTCTLAILESAPFGEIEDACKKLRTPGLRLEKIDGRVRTRVTRRCADEVPRWLPGACRGPGPLEGARLADSDSIANCVASGSHCNALLSLDSTFEDPLSSLTAQHPDNLAFEFNAIAGNSFLGCLGAGVGTTTTTLPDTTTTTTMDSPPTTSTTTTLPNPTTTTTSTTLASSGDPQLVVTEIMSNPDAQSDGAGEYFEIRNAGGQPVDLSGLEVRDLGSDSFTVADSLVLAAGAYAVFAKSPTAAGGNVDYVYGSGMNLTNSSDAIVLVWNTSVVDQVAYDSAFPLLAGRAIEIASAAPSAATNDDPAAWCASDSPLGDGDFGSPKSASVSCLP